jgi:hypothetical protein
MELLEWSPTIVVNLKSLDTVLAWGIKIDILLAPADCVESLYSTLDYQHPLIIIATPADDEWAAALHYLKQQHRAVSALTMSPFWPVVQNFTSLLDIVIFSQQTRWSFIRSGSIQKQVADDSDFHILNNGTITRHIARNGVMKINQEKPFWIGEPV